MGVQQYLNQARRQMEGCIQDKQGTIQTNCNVLWNVQFTSNIPVNDGHDI